MNYPPETNLFPPALNFLSVTKLYQDFPQLIETAPADETDRSGCKPQVLCHLRVGKRRLFQEKQPQQFSTTRWKLPDGLAQRLLLLECLQHFRRDRNLFNGFRLHRVEFQRIGAFSLPVKRLVDRYSNQPGTQ